MTTQLDIWQEKYRPQTLDAYINLDKYKDKLYEWWKPFNDYLENMTKYYKLLSKPGKRKKRPELPDKIVRKPFLILYGEPGTGKTTLAHCFYKKYNMDVIEINSSDSRSKKLLAEAINTSNRSVVFDDNDVTKELGVIMDELDGLTSGDIGGVSALMELTILKEYDSTEYGPGTYKVRYPVICTTNSIKEKKMAPILDMGILINIENPRAEQLLKLATDINNKENIGLCIDKLTQIANTCPQDYRKLIEIMYRLYMASDKSREFNNIMLDFGMSTELNKYANLSIKDLSKAIIEHVPRSITVFNSELEHLIEADSLMFFLNLLDNYADIAPDLDNIKTISSNYMDCEKYITWKKLYEDPEQVKDWNIQNYINYIGIYSNYKLLNKLRHDATNKQDQITINYHSKYNCMKTDIGYYNNNIVNYESRGKSIEYNLEHCLFTSDLETFLLANKMFKYIIGNTKHTTNIKKKIQNSFLNSTDEHAMPPLIQHP